jgi:hypothetical protein
MHSLSIFQFLPDQWPSSVSSVASLQRLFEWRYIGPLCHRHSFQICQDSPRLLSVIA